MQKLRDVRLSLRLVNDKAVEILEDPRLVTVTGTQDVCQCMKGCDSELWPLFISSAVKYKLYRPTLFGRGTTISLAPDQSGNRQPYIVDSVHFGSDAYDKRVLFVIRKNHDGEDDDGKRYCVSFPVLLRATPPCKSFVSVSGVSKSGRFMRSAYYVAYPAVMLDAESAITISGSDVGDYVYYSGNGLPSAVRLGKGMIGMDVIGVDFGYAYDNSCRTILPFLLISVDSTEYDVNINGYRLSVRVNKRRDAGSVGSSADVAMPLDTHESSDSESHVMFYAGDNVASHNVSVAEYA